MAGRTNIGTGQSGTGCGRGLQTSIAEIDQRAGRSYFPSRPPVVPSGE